MGKGKQLSSTNKILRQSSGQTKAKKILRDIKLLERKVVRWDRYRAAGKSVSKNNDHRSRFTWDTTGLLKEITRLNKYLGQLSNKG